MTNLAANIPIAPNGGFVGFGPLGTNQGSASSVNTFAGIISTAIGIMTVVAFIWFIFILITGSISLMGSGGDKQAIESARKKITTGIIGLLVVVSSIFIFDLIGYILGVNFTTLDQLLILYLLK